MGFIERELARLHKALDGAAGNPRQPEIYAAQQALCWALDPQAYASPFNFVTGTQGGLEGYPECHSRPQSSDISGLTGRQ